MSASPAEAPRSLLRDADFLKLWIGRSISGFGTQVTILAGPVWVGPIGSIVSFLPVARSPIAGLREMPDAADGR